MAIKGDGTSQRVSRASPCVVISPEEMQGYVGLVTDHPAIMRLGWNMEQLTCSKLDYPPVRERRCRRPRDDPANVLDETPALAKCRANVLGPPPTWLVGCAPDGQPTDMDNLEPALGQLSDLVRLLEALQDDDSFHVPSI